ATGDRFAAFIVRGRCRYTRRRPPPRERPCDQPTDAEDAAEESRDERRAYRAARPEPCRSRGKELHVTGAQYAEPPPGQPERQPDRYSFRSDDSTAHRA